MLQYGIVGNCKSCALISNNASIDWFCFPTFSSPSVFAKILDKKKGGAFEIHTLGKYNITQKYIENTNVLETTFTSGKNKFVVMDFFPRYRKLLPNRKTKLFRQNRLMRIIKPLRGKPIIKVRYNPKLNYAKGKTKLSVIKNNLVARNNKTSLSMISNLDYDVITNDLHFKLDKTKYFIIGKRDNHEHFNVTHCLRLLNWTRQYWKKWTSTLILPEQNRKYIIRSALALKLLTFSESGAIIAAATTSIPEEIGGQRNWDYRFCWIRDAAFTVDALKKIGRNYEPKKLMGFIFENTLKKKEHMQIMYGINGESRLTERKLNYLEGFKGSKPVRVGNAAYFQKQNDIYGSVIDVLYLYYVYYEYEKRLPKKYWLFLKHLVKEIQDHWKEEDHGIWEFRKKKQHFTYSKLMCYVGIDRAVRIAHFFKQDKVAEKWILLREKIKEDILIRAWNEKKRAFTMYYGSDELDASVLRMVYHSFLDSDDPMLIDTVKAVEKELSDGVLVQRYKVKDDFGQSKSTFAICSFWLIEALYTIGKVKEAKRMFNKVVKYSNHLGLFSEDISIRPKRLLGNFPQAYTHIALINTSILLSEWSAKRKKIDLTVIPKSRRTIK